MPITHVKLSPPSYDSTLDKPPWAEFSLKFLHFVFYSGGPNLIRLVDSVLGTQSLFQAENNMSFAADTSINLSMAEIASAPGMIAVNDDPFTWASLTNDEKQLDADIYNILCMQITGKHKSVLSKTQIYSFVQAWVLLSRELGASNIKRKTDLLKNLQHLQFNNDVAKFKTEATNMVKSIYDGRVTLEDVIMYSIMSSLPSELISLKIVQADQLDSENKTQEDVYNFIDTTATTLEIAGINNRPKAKPALMVSTENHEKPCTRCGRIGHVFQDCYATKHVSGKALKGAPPAKRRAPANKTTRPRQPPTSTRPRTRVAKAVRWKDEQPANEADMLKQLQGLRVSKLPREDNTSAHVMALHVFKRKTHRTSTSPDNSRATRDNAHPSPYAHAAIIPAPGEPPALCAAGCPQPSWNGKIGEHCSRSCRARTINPQVGAMCAAGCDIISWNGKPGEYCTRRCRSLHCQECPPSTSAPATSLAIEVTNATTTDSKVAAGTIQPPLQQQSQYEFSAAQLEEITEYARGHPAAPVGSPLSVEDGTVTGTGTLVKRRAAPSTPQSMIAMPGMSRPAARNLIQCGLTHVVLDSGCEDHLSPSVQVSNTKSKYDVVGFTGDSPITTTGTGNLTLNVLTPDGTMLWELTDAHQADIPHTLISLGKLIQDGYVFTAENDQVTLCAPDGANIPVEVNEDNLLVIPIEDTGTLHALYVKNNSKKRLYAYIHQVLGHCSYAKVLQTLHVTIGVSATGKNLDDFFCPVCAFTKQTRKPLSKAIPSDRRDCEMRRELRHSSQRKRGPVSSSDITLLPFEFVFADIKNLPYETPILHYKYTIVYVCANTNYITVHPLRAKTESAESVKRFILSNKMHKMPYACAIYTDGDGQFNDFDTTDFHAECALYGIHHENIPPHTPELNPAERAIRAVFDMVRAVLYDASLSCDYVVEAAKYSAYTLNRTAMRRHMGRLTDAKIDQPQRDHNGDTPTGAVEDRPTDQSVLSTPFEMVHHQSPSIGHLKPFGCTAYVLLPKKKRRDKSPMARAEIGTLLGYSSPVSNSYRILLHDTNTVVDSIHCTFDVENFGRMNSLPAQVPPPGTDTAALAPTLPSKQTILDDDDMPDAIVEIMADDVFSEGNAGNATAVRNETNHGETPDSVAEDTEEADVRPMRKRKQPEFLTYSGDNHEQTTTATLTKQCYFLSITALKTAPEVSVKAALNGPDRDKWIEAINKEWASLDKRFTPIPPDHPEYAVASQTITTGRFVLTKKRDGRYKARGVIQGFTEDPDLDGEGFNYYAHVAKLSSLRLLLFRPGRPSHYRVQTADVATAFLSSKPYSADEPRRYVRMRNPVTSAYDVFAVEGPVYGSRSSPRRWEDDAAETLEALNFKRGENDPSVYYRNDDDIRVLVYVDDILSDGPPKALENMFKELKKKYTLRDIHTLSVESSIDYIGVNITTDGINIALDMEEYITKTLAYMDQHMTLPHSTRTPIKGPIIANEPLDAKESKLFRTAVGCLGWLACTTRMDLAYAHSRISQHMANPTEASMKAARHAMMYLKGTTNLKLQAPMYKAQPNYTFYTDSDHAGNREPQNHCRSQLGHVALINDTPFVWKSTNLSSALISPLVSETIPALSVGEAEVQAYTNGVTDFLQISYIASELNIEFPSPITIQTDSTVAIAFTSNTMLKTKMKHIDVRQSWVHLIRNLKVAQPMHCGTTNNKSDYLTKIFPGTKWHEFLRMIFANCK